MHVKVLILGGGLTGLSTAYHLETAGYHDYLVLEKETEPGGLCRSIYKNGFTFDYAGHLLHLHTTQGKKLVRKLLGQNIHRLYRRAWIYTHTSRIPFPFQAHLYALPPQKRLACVEGLLAAKATPPQKPTNFEEFCLRAFGRGIYRQFMCPYNTKLWGCKPRELTCEWCGPFVPVPSVRQIQQSALKKPLKSFGYNASFYYPRRGGCGALVYALATHVSQLKLATQITQIDLTHKTILVGKETFSYDTLINTLPLSTFLRLLKKTPTLKQKASQLHAQDISVYHLALKGKPPRVHWIYCPDPQDPFYRIGVQSNFAKNNAPTGCYSLYVELSGNLRPCVKNEQQIYQALVQKGIISKYDEKLFSFWQHLPQAYVRYDKKRTPVLRTLLETLQKQHCLCAGRYGKWEYSFMESSLLQGKELAEKLLEKIQ